MEEDLVMDTARKFRRVNRMMTHMIDRKVSGTQVYRGQHQVLMHIAHHPDASQAEIAGQMEISPSALAVTLKKLEKGGYIVRSTDTSDDRKKHIGMTESGSVIVAESHRMFKEIENQMFYGLSGEELEILGGLMSRIEKNLQNMEQDSKEE